MNIWIILKGKQLQMKGPQLDLILRLTHLKALLNKQGYVFGVS